LEEVTVAAVQMELRDAFTRSEVEENVAHALEMVERAASRGAEIIGLPEFFNVGSWLENGMPREVVEPLNGPTYQRVVEKAVELGVWLVAGTIPAERNGKIFNAGIIVSPEGEVTDFSRGMYFPGFYELEGKYPVVSTRKGRIGCIICGDILLTEIPRLYGFRSVEIVFHPTLANENTLRMFRDFAWVRAVENFYFIVQVNPIAYHPKVGKLPGRSVIFSPFGERLAEAPEDREHILVAELEPRVRERKWLGMSSLTDAKMFFEGPMKSTIRRINFNETLAAALNGACKT